jgi:polar amino acid transport system substrate-binding protein/glutamate/aspartate transport system substrate-binding protein
MAAIGKSFFAAILTTAALIGSDACAGTLDDIRANSAVRIAYREDAPPFSYRRNNAGEPMGFMLDLCRSVVSKIGQQLGIADLKVTYVPVTSADRFEVITSSKADLLCEATTQTLKRRESVGFSIPTFVDGASFIIGANGPKDFKNLEGKKVGVLVNTTTEADLKRSLDAARINAEVVSVKSHIEGIDAVEKGSIAAYYADRGILTFLLVEGGRRPSLLLADTYLSVEPYALALRRGDEDFRLAVDRALSRIYRSGEIAKILALSFGAPVQPSQFLQGLYMTSALPE